MGQRRMPPEVIGGGGYAPAVTDPRRMRSRRPNFGASVIRGLLWWIQEIEAARRGGWYSKFHDANARQDATKALEWLRRFTLWAAEPYGDNLARDWKERRAAAMDEQADPGVADD